MLKTELKLDYSLNNSDGDVPVIVVAAGSSSRMKGTNKQLLELAGVPVVIRTLKAFENCEKISRIILVVRAEDLFTIQMLCEKYSITKLTDIVCGGASRQESVLKGFARLEASCQKVLIHDGARPFIKGEVICSVIDGLERFSACGCAVKVKDTIKQIDSDGKVIRTVPREDLVYIQTPQGVRVEEYLKAVENIDVSVFTDDTSIMEAAGYSVGIVEGDYKNIKITTAEDIILAQGFLSEEE